MELGKDCRKDHAVGAGFKDTSEGRKRMKVSAIQKEETSGDPGRWGTEKRVLPLL